MKLDIVVPFFNEEECVESFVNKLLASFSSVKDLQFRLLLVDDGSTDQTGVLLDNLAVNEDRIDVFHLWGNHGHQKALVAGLDHCDGDCILMMDGDGQHPVGTALDMVQMYVNKDNIDVVQALRQGKQSGFLKNATSKVFYYIVNLLISGAEIKEGASDFRVISRDVLHLIKCYPDRYRNIRVLLASLKLNTRYIDYVVEKRIAGSSHYHLRDMLALASDGWFAFSMSPLRISLLLMLSSFFLVILYMAYAAVMLIFGHTVPGWTSIIALIALMFSSVFAVLAILSEYVARIYADVRRHPVYSLRKNCKS